MALTDDDKEWLNLTLKNASNDAFERHIERSHKPLVERLDCLEKTVEGVNGRVWWITGIGSGAAVMVAAIWRVFTWANK